MKPPDNHPDDLVAIPDDPTRRYALALHWPGVGYWSWIGKQWEPYFTGGSLTPLRTEGGSAIARPTYPPLRAAALLELHVLDADGRSAGVEGVETIYPA